MITATVTARRAGHPEPLPEYLLRALAHEALTPEERALAARTGSPAPWRGRPSEVKAVAEWFRRAEAGAKA